jgi:hypothetical protein
MRTGRCWPAEARLVWFQYLGAAERVAGGTGMVTDPMVLEARSKKQLRGRPACSLRQAFHEPDARPVPVSAGAGSYLLRCLPQKYHRDAMAENR